MPPNTWRFVRSPTFAGLVSYFLGCTWRYWRNCCYKTWFNKYVWKLHLFIHCRYTRKSSKIPEHTVPVRAYGSCLSGHTAPVRAYRSIQLVSEHTASVRAYSSCMSEHTAPVRALTMHTVPVRAYGFCQSIQFLSEHTAHLKSLSMWFEPCRVTTRIHQHDQDIQLIPGGDGRNGTETYTHIHNLQTDKAYHMNGKRTRRIHFVSQFANHYWGTLCSPLIKLFTHTHTIQRRTDIQLMSKWRSVSEYASSVCRLALI